MRTNIDIDDSLLAQAMKYASTKSKRGVVHEALATYVATKNETRRRQTYRERLHRVREKTANIHLAEDSRDLLRKDRDSR